jgi:hypothetical protein
MIPAHSGDYARARSRLMHEARAPDDAAGLYARARSLCAQMKPYWRDAPWTQETGEAGEVRARVARLVETLSPPSREAPRALSNPECDPLFWSIVNANPTFVDM